LVHGSARTQRLVHAALFIVVILTVPTNIKHGLRVGEWRRVVYTRLERDMNAHSTLFGGREERLACAVSRSKGP
jgi:hypothetical protein